MYDFQKIIHERVLNNVKTNNHHLTNTIPSAYQYNTIS